MIIIHDIWNEWRVLCPVSLVRHQVGVWECLKVQLCPQQLCKLPLQQVIQSLTIVRVPPTTINHIIPLGTTICKNQRKITYRIPTGEPLWTLYGPSTLYSVSSPHSLHSL